MQLPPPADLVLRAVDAVMHQIENQQVQEKADQRLVRYTGPQVIELRRHPTPQAHLPHERIHQRFQQKKHTQFEKPKPVDQGVQDIGAYRRGVGDRLHRAPALQRPQNDQQHQNLPDTEQKPHGAFKGWLQIASPSDGHQKRLHQALKKGLVQEVEDVG